MSEKDTIVKKTLDAVKVMYDDDIAIVDFLSDLKCRELIYDLERYVCFTRREPACFLCDCKADALTVMVCYKANFLLNTGCNKLVLFAYSDLRGLCIYFHNWIDTLPASTPEDVRNALKEAYLLLSSQWAAENDDNVQSDFLG